MTSSVIIRSAAAYQHMSLNMSNERCPQKDLSSHLSFFAIEVINCWRMLLEIVSWMRRSHLGYSLRYCPQIVPTIIFEIFSWLLSLRGTKIRRSKIEDYFPIVHYNRSAFFIALLKSLSSPIPRTRRPFFSSRSLWTCRQSPHQNHFSPPPPHLGINNIRYSAISWLRDVFGWQDHVHCLQ